MRLTFAFCLMLASNAAVSVVDSCPIQCSCFFHKLSDGSKARSVLCNNPEITAVPSNFPADTSKLRIEKTAISRISADNFHYLNGLVFLWMSFNSISSLNADSFRGLSSLNELRLDGNALADFPWESLGNTPNLRLLDLHNNKMESIPSEAAAFMKNITYLDLSSNNLGTVPGNVLAMWLNVKPTQDTESKVILGLHDNPWTCDCRLFDRRGADPGAVLEPGRRAEGQRDDSARDLQRGHHLVHPERAGRVLQRFGEIRLRSRQLRRNRGRHNIPRHHRLAPLRRDGRGLQAQPRHRRTQEWHRTRRLSREARRQIRPAAAADRAQPAAHQTAQRRQSGHGKVRDRELQRLRRRQERSVRQRGFEQHRRQRFFAASTGKTHRSLRQSHRRHGSYRLLELARAHCHEHDRIQRPVRGFRRAGHAADQRWRREESHHDRRTRAQNEIHRVHLRQGADTEEGAVRHLFDGRSRQRQRHAEAHQRGRDHGGVRDRRAADADRLLRRAEEEVSEVVGERVQRQPGLVRDV
ncbi:uncharacterized protein [Eucyclogobius newberryi]|uniref:uncharacterized protein isoform X2 n=1 Tax=Eucyclogobius newberryi TaxID=166745 RepID=UPI003B5A2444